MQFLSFFLKISYLDSTIETIELLMTVRGMLKSWTKLWCVLKPGVILLYKSDKGKVLPTQHEVSLLMTTTDGNKSFIIHLLFRIG